MTLSLSPHSGTLLNMLDAKSQLSRLVKAALADEEVIIVSMARPR